MERRYRAVHRRRVRRKRYIVNAKRLMLCILLILLAVEVALAAYTSPWFYVKHKRVVGNKTVSSSEILDRLQIPHNCNIFALNKREAESRLAGDSVVKEVRLYRRPPNTLIIRVVERMPDLVLSTGGKLYEVDSSAVPFRVVDEADARLPVLSCEVRERIILGQPLDDAAFNTGRNCLLLARAEKKLRVAKLTVDPKNYLCLNTTDGFQVKLGRPEQLSEKLDIAARAVEQIPEFSKSGQYIDVTCVEAAALKLAE